MRSPWSHGSGNRFEEIDRVDFHLYLKHYFLNISFAGFFHFPIYRVILISCPKSCV